MNRINIILAFLLSFITLHAICQNPKNETFHEETTMPVQKHWGISDEGFGPKEWKAFWIWRSGESLGNNLVMLARRSFDLDEKPDQARIYITADNLYALYVNGVLVNRGPARSQPSHQYYDILDISSLMVEGKNVLAISMLHHGSFGSFNLPPRPGLLAQLEIRTGDSLRFINTDASYKVHHADWIQTSSEKYCEVVDMRKAQKAWQDVDFDDSTWPNATELVSDTYLAWPGPSQKSKPLTLTSPWKNLIARDIPYLNESTVKAAKLIEAGEIMELGFQYPVSEGLHGLLFPIKYCAVSGTEEYAKGTAPLIVSNAHPEKLFSNEAIYSTYLIFDLGEIMHGYPRLEIEGEAGTIVELVYATHLLRGKFPMRSNWEGRPVRRPSTDRIILAKGQNTWDAIDMKYMRYLLVAVRNTDKPVTISFAGLNRTSYPFESNGFFHAAKDESLNWLWQASKNTLEVVTTDAFTDNYRERLQYVQTSYYAARCSYATSGDSYLQRRYLIQTAREQQSDGILPASAPVFETRGQRFLDASLFWIFGLHDYFLHAGDTLTSRMLLPTAEKILDSFQQWENRDGFIESPPYTYWIDHANIERYGAHFSLNAIYLLAMKDVMNICNWLNETEKASKYNDRIQQLSSNMQISFWDNQEELFRDVLIDGELTGKYTEHSNSLAIVAGIATPHQQTAIMREMVGNRSDRLVKAVLFMQFIAESLFMSGQGEAAIGMLKDRYSHMKDEGAQTLWEEWSQTVTFRRGDFAPSSHITVSQAENTYPAYSLSKWLLGIHPVSPGMKEVTIAANLCGTQELSGSMPTPFGNISVNWQQTKNKLVLEIIVPQGIKARLDLNTIDRKQKIMMNGINITETFLLSPAIPAGKTILEFN